MVARVAVVTGAAQGIGRACSVRLAPSVDVVVVVDRDEEALARAADALQATGRIVVALPMDVTDRAALHLLASQVDELGSLEVLAHLAGVGPDTGDWRRVFEVNLVASALLIEALTPLVGKGTAAVCCSSIAAHMGVSHGDAVVDSALDDPLHPLFLDRVRAAAGPEIEDSGVAYGWAKRGVQRLVRRTSVAWGSLGARICSISPGIINTQMGRGQADHPTVQKLLDLSPIPRMGEPEEVAALVGVLCSPDASYVTGCDLLVDGGMCAAIEALSAGRAP